MSKYQSFSEFLDKIKEPSYRCSFKDIEKIIGEELPPSAYKYDAWWSNNASHPLMKGILSIGWKKVRVDFILKEIQFERIESKTQKVFGNPVFERLENFIMNEMRPQANYQPVMIMALIQHGGRLSKDELAFVIRSFNQDNLGQNFKTIPVYEVLVNHKIVTQNDDNFFLNGYDGFNSIQKDHIVSLCEQKIHKLNTNQSKIAICWPTDELEGKIEKFCKVITEHGKVLWGVNWGLPQIKKSDFPIKGYLYYRGNIVAIAEIIDITEHRNVSPEDYKLRPAGSGELENYDFYLHLTQLNPCEPFPHSMLEMWDPDKKIPDVVQQRVYVKEVKGITQTFKSWIWSVTPENWEIVKSKKIWASRIPENIRTRVRPPDKVIFYVQGTGQFQGIYEFDGEWYDAKEPVWTDETNSVIYPSQIKLKPVKLGNINVYDIASKLKLFPHPEDKRIVNLVLKGGAGYPSNNGKPIPYEDYLTILRLMSTELNDETVNYWKISPGARADLWDEQRSNSVIAIGWNNLGNLKNKSFEEIHSQLRKIWPDQIAALSPQFRDFLSIKKGDIIIANKGINRIVGIGRVIGDYQYRPNLTFHHTYPVEWFDVNEKEIPEQDATWRKTIFAVSPEQYQSFISGTMENHLLLRYTKAPSKYSDMFGEQYEYGKIANYTKIENGAKVIWFDRKDGQFIFWGHGTVDQISKINDERFSASMRDFVSFIPPKIADDAIQGKITKQPGYNIQSSILPITKQIYEQILGIAETAEEQIPTFEDEPLPIPTKNELEEGYKKISEELLIPEEKIIEIVTALASGRHVLLAGPIGTGKTELARMIPAIFWGKYGGYYSEDHTATSDWSTQDVIGGIFPKMNKNGEPIYEIQNGCVVETVQKNWFNGVDGGSRRNSKNPQKIPPYRGTWLIIDEFNRAEIDKAFGQLFTALRTRTLKIPTNAEKISYKTLKIPEDYRIIGTLNTADKHYLFQLSDALKSRFAYIEIDIPKKEQFEQEIYYAMKNALADLATNHYEDLVILDHQTKKINKERSNSEFYERIYQAYHFLDSVRIFKKLGTAILKLVYQNLLVGTKMTGNSRTALDNALTSNLIPQLENLSQSAIGAIHALYSDSIVKYFQDAYKNPNRQSYVDAFTAVLEYLQVPNTQLVAQFANGNLNVEDSNTWRPILTSYDAKKKEFELQLDQLKQSMEDLIQTMVI